MGGAAPRTGYKVRITGLPEGMRWSELKDFVRKAGDVTYADVRGDEGCVGPACTFRSTSLFSVSWTVFPSQSSPSWPVSGGCFCIHKSIKSSVAQSHILKGGFFGSLPPRRDRSRWWLVFFLLSLFRPRSRVCRSCPSCRLCDPLEKTPRCSSKRAVGAFYRSVLPCRRPRPGLC